MKHQSIMAVALVVAFTSMGCKIKLAPETQNQLAEINAKRELAVGYARAAKTPQVLSEPERVAANKAYDAAFTEVAKCVGVFELQVRQTNVFQTVKPDPITPSATKAVQSLNTFIDETRANVDRPRPTDFAATAAAVAVGIEAAKKVGDAAIKWWNETNERERTTLVQFGQKVKLPVWTELKPYEVAPSTADR